ncbi:MULTISPECIES: hypothetical protein [unclassified Rhizobium]|jgi:hypothetical protein|uniref:hypothetical protein n=1 Tax=unclassified Rhizobium TaxID=2613769 RepID=UPI00064596AF|nr:MULTISPECIES: hypothetical protein [unclassified Rhizobium]MBN8952508.1 hypothetical protein [Rhizobium tropici]OJY78984.1 MAG: hypothetical protein BGP09_24085 [Rhizobium sp. 60-20]RKD67709.1 hypothetical protein BJ928_105110 [Rhizobium sp. WW_1]
MAVDENFFHPRRPVSIVALGDSGEALLLRAILESLGAVVTLHLPATPSDFLKCVDQGTSAPRYMILSGHGEEGGLVFGEFDEGIDTSMLVAGCLPAEQLDRKINLPGCVVLSTACLSGTEAFASAFLAGGVSAYIASIDYPDGAAIPLFVHGFFYHLFQQQPLRKAFDSARTFDPADDLSLAIFEKD